MVCMSWEPSKKSWRSDRSEELLIRSPERKTVPARSSVMGMVQRSVLAARAGGQPATGSTECTALGAFEMTLPFAVNFRFPFSSSFSEGAEVPMPTPYPVTAMIELPVPPPFGEKDITSGEASV